MKTKEVKSYVTPVVLDVKDCIKVLLVAENDSKILSLPMIELDSEITMHDALKNFLDKIVPLNIKMENIFYVYKYDEDGVTYTLTAFMEKIDREINESVDFDKGIPVNKNHLDFAVFYRIEDAIENSKIDGDECHVSDLTGDILQHIVEYMMADGDSNEGDEDIPDENRILNSTVESLVESETEEFTTLPKNKDEFLNEYDKKRESSELKVDVGEVSDLDEAKSIVIADAERVILVFKNSKNLKLSFDKTCLIECMVSKRNGENELKIEKLEDAYKSGKISKDLYEKNLAKFKDSM